MAKKRRIRSPSVPSAASPAGSRAAAPPPSRCSRSVALQFLAVAVQVAILGFLFFVRMQRGAGSATSKSGSAAAAMADDASALMHQLETIIVEEHVKQLDELEREHTETMARIEERHTLKLAKVVKRYKSQTSGGRKMRGRGGNSSETRSGESSAAFRIAVLKKRIASFPETEEDAGISGTPETCMSCIECVKSGRTFEASTMQCVAGKGKWWTASCLPEPSVCPGYKGLLTAELNTLATIVAEGKTKSKVKTKSKSLASAALGFPFDMFSAWGWNTRTIGRYLDYSPDLCCRLLPRMHMNAPSICCQTAVYKATPQRWAKMKPPFSPPPYPEGVIEFVKKNLQGKTLHLIGDSINTQFCNHIGCALRASALELKPFIVERSPQGGGGEQVMFAQFGIPSLDAEIWCSELHAVYENARNTANYKKMLAITAQSIEKTGRQPVIALNLGLHVHDPKRLEFELAGVTKELAEFVERNRKAIVLLRETSPQHFPTSTGSGLFEDKEKGTCSASKVNVGNWRNDALKAAAISSGIGGDHIIDIYADSQPWWDAHSGQWAKEGCSCDAADPKCDCTVTDCTHMCVGPPVWEMWVHRLGTKLSMLASDAADEDEDDEDDR